MKYILYLNTQPQHGFLHLQQYTLDVCMLRTVHVHFLYHTAQHVQQYACDTDPAEFFADDDDDDDDDLHLTSR